MASTSGDPASRELLERCLNDQGWTSELLNRALLEREGRALLQIVVERLADLFEPKLVTTYSRLFADVIERLDPAHRASDTIERYERIRQIRRFSGPDPLNIFVLSRVTLGADVAVTSVCLNAMQQRFPKSNVWFVGSRKNFELFEADPAIRLHEFDYPRGSALSDRIRLRPRINAAASIVIDPDSRLTQLGLLPICDDESYYFFESRSYGGDSKATVVELTSHWLQETFGCRPARQRLALLPPPFRADIAVSLGVGDNPEKRVADPFEADVIATLAGLGRSVVVDEGASPEEGERVRRIASTLGPVRTWRGSYAPFASMISQASLYVGYDSAGQHVAAASGVPLISIFAGYASDRMFARWRPDSSGPAEVIKVEGNSAEATVARVRQAIQYLTR